MVYLEVCGDIVPLANIMSYTVSTLPLDIGRPTCIFFIREGGGGVERRRERDRSIPEH